MTIILRSNIVKTVLTVFFIMFISQSFGRSFSSGEFMGNVIAEDSIKIETVTFHLIEPSEGIAIYKDQVLIFSNTKYQHRMAPEHVSFGLNGTYLVKPDNFESHVNKLFIAGDRFPFDPARMIFSPDYKILYYSGRNNEVGGSEKIYSVPIKESNSPSQFFVDESSVEMLPFCSDDYTYRHPAMSADDSYMVYASNNEESIGRFDLFMVKHDENFWGEPINLGDLINTDNDELYPFLDNYNNLYFSSNGHSGLGGFDIYICKYSEGGWGSPENLSRSINSKGDELALKIDQENHRAYYTVLTRTDRNERQLLRLKLNEGNFSDNLHLIAQNKEAMGNTSHVDKAKKKEPKPVHKAPKESRKELKAASKKKTEKEASLTRKVVAEALLAKKAEEEALLVKKAEEDAMLAKKAEAEALLAKKAEAEALLAKKAEEDAMLAKKAEEEALLAKKAEAEALLAKKAEAEAMLAKKAEEPTTTKEEELTRTESSSNKEAEKNIPFFRVQITSSSKSKSNYRVDIDGNSYPTFEYYYIGAYRYTVGNFRSVKEAISFKNKCRASGFSQAFVAAFINDVRETDPAVFKR